METANFLGQLTQVANQRQQLVGHLDRMVAVLGKAEGTGKTQSGELGLAADIETVQATRQSVDQGVFRLLVLGDVKRGKSTVLNALLGETLLPSDVAPCTALLTVLKYGEQRQVTIHYNDGTPPTAIDFQTFKTRYTIDPEETKRLDESGKSAFPTISHAVIEHPLALLKTGLEIIDTPGLNDTEARNQQVLEFANRCHAVLFVLSAIQPVTLDERRYLQNYLRDRGLELFFLINGWDRLKAELLNPEDPEELEAATRKQRQVFQTHLGEYVGGSGNPGDPGNPDKYNQRVFETSALQALRKRLKDRDADLVGTGIAELFTALSQYLAQERARTEWERVHHIVRLTHQHVQDVVDRRIPLLTEDATELQARMASLEEDFAKLASIRDQFRTVIASHKDDRAKAIADSFRDYLLKLELTFEQDFVAAQPDLDFLDFLQKDKRDKFTNNFRRAFERYMNDRLAGWEFIAKQDLAKAFTDLNDQAKVYAEAYSQAVESMNSKILGGRYEAVGSRRKAEGEAVWADYVAELFTALPDNLNGMVQQFSQFWQTVLLYACIYAAIQIALIVVSIVFSSLAFSILAGVAIGAGVVATQAEIVRQNFLTSTKQEFVKALPQIAADQCPVIQRAIQRSFEDYEAQVVERINTDIASRQSELKNLLKQKQTYEVNTATETDRLRQLEQDIRTVVSDIAALGNPTTV
jgi:GTPase SAR1 family protein